VTSVPADESIPEHVRESVLAAAYDEITRWGIDRFSIVSLAGRHELDPELIRHHWGGEADLILDVFVGWPDIVTAPDTGSLRSDLLALATGMAIYVSTEVGRRLQSAHVILNPDHPTADIRRAIWRARGSTLRSVVDLARQRGELREGVDSLTVLELLFAPINMRALFTGEPIDDEYCRALSDMVWRAVTSPPIEP
jgi:Tetracyclin repressor-like, C-terminal domain